MTKNTTPAQSKPALPKNVTDCQKAIKTINLYSIISTHARLQGMSLKSLSVLIGMLPTSLYYVLRRQKPELHILILLSNALKVNLLGYYYGLLSDKLPLHYREQALHEEHATYKAENEQLKEKIKELETENSLMKSLLKAS